MFQSTERLTREHQSDFKRAFTSVAHASNVFQDDDIWPGQCDQAVASIQHMSKLVKHLYKVTDTSSAYFSPNVDNHRNRLLTILRGLEMLLNYDLLPYIKTFRTICRTSSIQAFRQRERIQYKFELLQDDSESALNTLRMLLEQAGFEEKMLENIG